jgi:hypothetical protein
MQLLFAEGSQRGGAVRPVHPVLCTLHVIPNRAVDPDSESRRSTGQGCCLQAACSCSHGHDAASWHPKPDLGNRHRPFSFRSQSGCVFEALTRFPHVLLLNPRPLVLMCTRIVKQPPFWGCCVPCTGHVTGCLALLVFWARRREVKPAAAQLFSGYPPTAIGFLPTAIVGRIGYSEFFSFLFITAPPGSAQGHPRYHQTPPTQHLSGGRIGLASPDEVVVERWDGELADASSPSRNPPTPFLDTGASCIDLHNLCALQNVQAEGLACHWPTFCPFQCNGPGFPLSFALFDH